VKFLAEDTDNLYVGSGVIFPMSPPTPVLVNPPREPECVCVYTRSDLTEAVKICNPTMDGPSCRIDICSTRLTMTGTNNNGVDISNKNIVLVCDASCPAKRCILDGLGFSRFFYGSNTNVTFINFIFFNGFHPNNGGSIKIENNSIASFINCSFVSNSSPFGSTIYVDNTNLTITGIASSIINNTGIGPTIHVLSSHLNISDAVFANNNETMYSAELLLFNTTIEVYNVHFLRSLALQQANTDNCNVYVPLLANDFAQTFTCMTFDGANKTFPIVDLSEYCPTSSLYPTAAPRPVPTICFSGDNLSNECTSYWGLRAVQARYIYPFWSLASQVQMGTFLRMTFYDNRVTESFLPFAESFLEISAMH
jgi:hypothetical protein